MRPSVRRAAVWLATAVVFAGSLAACGHSSTGSTSSTSSKAAATGLHVTPASGPPTAVFTLRFVAPASSGSDGHTTTSYTLGITGPAGGGCARLHSIPVPLATKNQPVSVAMGATTLGRHWCVGTYRAQALELQRPVCAAGAACPQYVRVVGVGTARFRVTTA